MKALAWMGAVTGSCALATAAIAAAPAITPSPTPADYTALARLPDWSGIWQPDWKSLFGAGGRKPMEPPVTPAAAKILADYVAAQKKGENLQSDSANCVPPGMPQIMRMPYPIEFIYAPGRVTIIAETESQVRRVYTDGRPLPDDPDATYNGSSIGHWESETLVVETVGLNPHTSLVPGVHPTEKTRIREVFRMTKPDNMEVETTITDPDVLAQPLVLMTNYLRKREWQIREYVCQENNRDAADPFGRPSLNISK